MTRRPVVLLIVAAITGGAFVAGCAQLPWIQGTETDVVPVTRPTVLPPGAVTTATPGATTVDSPFPLISMQAPKPLPSGPPSTIVPPPQDVLAQAPQTPPPAPPQPQPQTAVPTSIAAPPAAQNLQVVPGSRA